MRPGATWPTVQSGSPAAKERRLPNRRTPLDFQRIERGINLVVPLFGNGL